jgi:hypothetical protein
MVEVEQVMIVLSHQHSAVHTPANPHLGVDCAVASFQDILLVPALTAIPRLLGSVKFGRIGRPTPTAITHQFNLTAEIS